MQIKQNLSSTLPRALLTLLLGAACGLAQATPITCTRNIADNVSGTQSCAYSSSATQDFLNTNPLTVNAEQFFGFSDWAFNGKIGETAGFRGTDSGMRGAWSIPALGGSASMLVFKSGRDTTLVAYLLSQGATSGTWTSPFENPPFDVRNTKEVSHISVYTRGSTPSNQVPVPGTLSLLALPLLALLGKRRRT